MALRAVDWSTKDEDGVPGTKESYVGQVVDTWSTYLGDCDTTYGVVVWDDGEFKQVGGGYTPPNHEIDAPEDVMAAYEAEQAAKKAVGYANGLKQAVKDRERDEECERNTPRPGKPLVVVRGRKIKVGTKVECAWYGETQYGYRVKVTLPDGQEAWTSADNVEVDLEVMV